jgi:hypothetical protein
MRGDAAQQGVEADEAWSTSKLRRSTPVFDGRRGEKETKMAESSAGDRVSLYLRYLEVEMAIMGILSAFCVAAAGFVLKETLSAKDGFMATLWAQSGGYVIVGTALLTCAALCFYRQRSGLAWYHGQLCLSLQEPKNLVVTETTRDLLADADGWDTWIHYQRGFAFLSAGIAMLFGGLIVARHPEWVDAHGRAAGMGLASGICVVAAVWYGLFRRRLAKEQSDEEEGKQARRRTRVSGLLPSSEK